MILELTLRRVLFFLLLAVAPAFVFLGQAVIFEPPAAILASALSLVWLVVVAGENESPFMIGFFVVHFLIFSTLYWFVAFVLAKILTAIRQWILRLVVVIVAVVGIGLVTQQPFYGVGGHGASRLGNLQRYLSGDVESILAFPISYAASVACILVGILGWAFVRKPSSDPAGSIDADG